MPQEAPTKIERMTLEIPGGSARQGHQVALLVAAGLAEAGGLPQAGDLPHVRVTVEAGPEADPEKLARRIVIATLRALERTP